MTRLTDLESATPVRSPLPWHEHDLDPDNLMLRARHERAVYVGEQIGHLLLGIGAGLRALDRTLLGPLHHYLQRRRTAAELSNLSDHVLADIGVRREQIDQVALDCCHEAQQQEPPSLFRRLAVWYTLRAERRETIRDLRSLPDSVLTDIGVVRADIRHVADRLMQRKAEEAARGEREVVTVIDQLAVEFDEIKHAFVEWSHHPSSLRDFAKLARRWRGDAAANRNQPAAPLSHNAA